DLASARKAYEELGRQHDMSAEEVAAGVLEIAAVNQVFGIRKVTTSRGRDPGNYAMVAFGGAGGLFATEVADFLGMKTVISPPDPGNLCALGLHVSDVRRDYIRTMVRRQSAADTAEIVAAWNALAEEGRRDIRAEGIADDDIKIEYVADVRYFGEGHEVQVTAPDGASGEAAVAHMWKDFHRVHDESFGFHYEGEQDVELVNLRVRAVGVQNRPQIKASEKSGAPAKPFGARNVYWKGAGWVDSPLYERTELVAGQAIAGPAIIQEYGSTVVVPGGWTCTADRYRNLILTARETQS
ncbi:MAG: hydantoinase/oxoprolinase family protein, partial [Pseudaminobacter sp.]